MSGTSGPALAVSGIAAAVKELTGGRLSPHRVTVWSWFKDGILVGGVRVRLNATKVGHLLTATRGDVEQFLAITGRLKTSEKQVEKLTA